MSWQRVRAEFEALCELSAEAAEARLTKLQTTDAWLAEQVRELLASDRAAPSFLDREAPAAGVAATAGMRLGRYELVKPLGTGGMGSVWEARQSEPDRRVALKLVAWHGRDDEARWRFRHEAQVLAQLGHPAIATLYEVGESDLGGTAVAWLAMELVDGAVDLVAWADRERLGRRERLALLAQLGEAVEHGHRAGVLHRDLKPANVLVSRDGRLKLIDFGIARALGDDADAVQRTSPGAIVGTLAYMAPEQLRGDRTANGVASDVWSLGVIAYRLLCGRMPFDLDGLSFAAVVQRVLEQEPLPPRVACKDLSDELAWILQRSLGAEPTRRYATVRDLLDDLRRYERHEPVLAKPPSAAYRLRKFGRRHRLAVAVVAVLIAGLGTGALFLVRGIREAEAGARSAQRGAELARETMRVTVGMFDAIDETAKSRDVRVHELLERSKFEPGTMHEPAVEYAVRDLRGRVYARLRRFADARFEFEQALALWNHPEVSTGVPPEERRPRELLLRAVLGRALAGSGERERGESLLRDVLAAAANETAATRGEIEQEYCALLADAGANDELLQHATAWRDLARAAGDLRSARQAQGMMAEAASSLGSHDEAVAFAEAVFRETRDASGADAAATCSALSSCVRILQQAERLDDAEAHYPELLELTKRVYGPLHENALVVAGNYATLLLSRGKLAKALDGLRDVVQRYEQRGGEPTSDQLTMVNNLGMVLYQGAKFDAAEPYLRRAAELTKAVLDPRDANGVGIRFNHAACMAALKRWNDAKPRLLAEYALAESLLPAGHPTLGKMRRTLADCCGRNGEPEAAKEWRSR